MQPNSCKGILCRFHSVFIEPWFALWQREQSQAHFSESSQRGREGGETGGGGEEEEEGDEEEEGGGGEAGGGKSGVSLLLLQSKAYTEQQQAEKTVLYCFRPAGKVSLPETQQTTITQMGDEPKLCSLRDLPKW